MQMASEHLQAADAGALEPSLQLDVRQQLAQAYTHYCVEVTLAAADCALSSSSSSSATGGPMEGQEQRGEQASCRHLAAALQACGISLPCKVAGTIPAAADSTSSSSSAWQQASTGSPGGAAVAAVAKAAVTIPAPGAAAADHELRASGEGTSRVSVSSGVLGSAASDTEAPVVGHRPVSPLPPSPAATPERAPASAATTLPASSMSTPFGVSPRAATSSPKAGPTSRAKEGYGSYAKLLNRQATNSLDNSPGAAAALAAAAADVFASSVGRVSDAEGGEAAAAAAAARLAVQGGCLVEQGAMQWAPVHSGEVVAMAAQNRVAVSAGLDGYLKVREIQKLVHALVQFCFRRAMSQCECWARPCGQVTTDGSLPCVTTPAALLALACRCLTFQAAACGWQLPWPSPPCSTPAQLQPQSRQGPCPCCSCGTMGRGQLWATPGTMLSGLWT